LIHVVDTIKDRLSKKKVKNKTAQNITGENGN